MAINKKLIHFKTFANFNSQKLSANEANTKYTTGISGTETSGNPDILYQSICFIKDTQQIWTHGQIYNASAENKGEPYIIDISSYEDGQTGSEIEELYNNLANALLNNRPIYEAQLLPDGAAMAPMIGSYIAVLNTVILTNLITTDEILTSSSYIIGLQDGEYIFITNTYEKDLSALVNTYDLATINGQSLLNGGQDITIEGGTSGVFVKFNELFAEGTLTTNESDVFNVVKTAMESNTPLLLCDTNYSIIQVSYYPLKVSTQIIASGILSQNVYNFTFTSGSNQVSVTKLDVATLFSGYPDYKVVVAEGFQDSATAYEWALPDSDFSNEVGLENTLATLKDTPSYYTLDDAATPSILELFADSTPSKQETGNLIAVYFGENFQQQQEHTFIIGGNEWELCPEFAVEASAGDTLLFTFTPDYIMPVGAFESFRAKRANVLSTARYINGVSFNGSANITNYGTCSTAAATIAKTTSITGFNLVTGARISVNFTNGSTSASMTLNVSSTGAKSVVYRGNTNTPTLDAGTYDFIYTGSQWELLSTKGINKFTINRAAYTGVVYPDSFIRFYYSTGVTTLNVSSTTMSSAFAEYSFEFNSGSTPTVFTYPSTWKWANGTAPTINANKTYHVSVVNNCAVIAEF